MELKEELIEKVERYLSGELTRKEVKEENDKTLSDEELDEVIDLYNTSENLIELAGLREDLKSIHKEYIAETQGKKTTWIWWTAAVAAVLTFLLIFTGVLQDKSPEFNDFFTPYPDLISMRGGEYGLKEAMKYYSQQDYQAALKEFSNINPDSINQEVLFYQSIAALAVDQYQLAVTNLEKLSALDSNIYWQQTKWYLGLAYWQTGEIEKAKEIFAKIESGESQYDAARELLKEL